MNDERAREALPAPATRLAGLNRYIEQRTGHGRDARPALRSALAFHDAWARICADESVSQALQRAPENAGPLNSHRLVLRTLRLMNELSPEYLRHFMVQVDTLLWLDRTAPLLKPAAAKPLRKARPKP